MKVAFILLIAFSNCALGQSKFDYTHFNKLTEVSGTEYVIASIENWGKMFKTNSEYLLFINTKTGQTKQVDFPADANVYELEQVKIDSLDINVIIVSGQTVDLDEKKGIDWNDPKQIIILSKDGLVKTQLTENSFFTSTWTINRLTGTIVITGHFDTNKNGKYDKSDKSEILIYDLKTLKLVSRI